MQKQMSSLSLFIDLPFLKYQTIEKDSWMLYIVSVRLEDYWKFVSDGNGHVRRCLFDSDGWNFLLADHVNEQIVQALADPAESWLLNNGVRIMAANAIVLEKMIQLQDIQIINGLLITKIICHHFQGGLVTYKDRDLLVQIIVTSDAQVRDQIAKLTSIPGRPVDVDVLDKSIGSD